MTICDLLSRPLPLPLSHKPFPFSLNHSFLTLTHNSTKPRNHIKPRRPITAQSNGSDSADAPDRIISALCYFYPFFEGAQYGKHVVAQFPAVQTLIEPLAPAIRAYQSFPIMNGLLVFFTLYFVVVKNPNFSWYVRFNSMQAILLDLLLIVPALLENFSPTDGDGLDLMMSFDSTVFLFLLVCLIYGSSSCLLGLVPRLPIVAEVAEWEVL